jgi:hypothetical protein
MSRKTGSADKKAPQILPKEAQSADNLCYPNRARWKNRFFCQQNKIFC